MGRTIPVAIAAPGAAGWELLAAACFEGEAPPLDGLSEAPRRALQAIASRAGWKGKEEQCGETAAGDGAGVVQLHGLGKRVELTDRRLSAWLGGLVDAARGNGFTRLAVLLPRHPETVGPAAAARVLRAAALAGYSYERHQTERKCGALAALEVLPPSGEEGTYRGAAEEASAVAEAVGWARDLANAPANEGTPDWLEDQARGLAERNGFAMTVLDAAELERRGMGGVLAVGSGSVHPPRLLRLERGGSGPVVALVGKGVTFDTGGISIKPALDMGDMKYDKSGACAALGAARAAAALELPVRLRLYLPLAENMLDSRSYRPGDIVRCYNGKTVEITNTDAEGRMILADALALAAEERPDALLELSTLTGACVVALGHLAAGLYTPDDALAAELLAASARSGERLWRLPLWPEWVEEMKGTHADLKNSAGRWGGANTAAAFLSQFVGGLSRWAHLDIAGVAWVDPKEEGYRGATGFGVACTIDWLRHLGT
ncbi:MAG TPA: leucyl aminopeptidase family protein [Thermoanaerobaculia bacterium]|nr:leucyl aminopeptidase family protein [Thermoanaerobaculia bacterium]